MMRTCSAFGGLDKSSWARAVAGASSGSITTGADGGLRRQAPILKCFWLPRGLAGQPCSLAKFAKALAGVRGLNPTEWGIFDADTVLMGGRHQEEAGYISRPGFREGPLGATSPYPTSFSNNTLSASSVRHRAMQKEWLDVVSELL